MPARGLLALGLVVMLAATAVAVAAFTATSTNPSTAFRAASSFPGMRVATGAYVGNLLDDRAITTVGFRPDVVIIKGHGLVPGAIRSSTMSGDATKEVAPASATGLAANLIQSLDSNGFTLGSSDRVNALLVTYSWIALRAQQNKLKVGSYTGNGTSRAITGMGFSPEYVAVLGAGAQRAVERFAGMGRTYQFDSDNGSTTRITSLDSDGFTVGSDATTNSNGATYHYVALNDAAGNVKVGSYSGNNVDNRNVTGVGFAPDYVTIRAGNTTGSPRIAMHRARRAWVVSRPAQPCDADPRRAHTARDRGP
ncbi:MAG: hypothetical protein GEU88_00195 [Solirubrobacterales bacterium]|nr:hypothetical protein [Solirubrobacterales bacterium]